VWGWGRPPAGALRGGPTPAAELRISGVGPLVSLLLGVLFAGTAWLLDMTFAPALAVEAVAWLAAINILLALFNVIPAAPLDGGRLLRAVLWKITGDRLRATVGATTAGRVFGWLLVAFGLYVFLATAAFGGLWIALIGWFLIASATMEGRQAQLRELLAGVPVRHAMTAEPLTAPAGLPVADFLADERYRYRHSAFPVTDADGAPHGLVTVDQAQRVTTDERSSTTVDAIMVPLAEVRVAAPGDALADLLARLEPGAENRVLVIDAGRLAGIVSPSDVNRTVRWLMSTARHRRGRWTTP
jgi:CBS domain-containing protein